MLTSLTAGALLIAPVVSAQPAGSSPGGEPLPYVCAPGLASTYVLILLLRTIVLNLSALGLCIYDPVSVPYALSVPSCDRLTSSVGSSG